MRVSDLPILRQHWHPMGEAAAFGEQPVAARLLSTDLVIWRVAGVLHGAVDRCPHRHAKLSRGTVTPKGLECPYHAWCFDADGTAVSIPQLDEHVPIPPTARLSTVSVTERYGLVWASLDPPTQGVPPFPEGEDPAYRLLFSFDQPWAAAAPWVTDNAIDIAHVNVIHAATIGNAEARYLSPYEVTPTPVGFAAHLRLSVNGDTAEGTGETTTERTMTVELAGPFSCRVAIRYPNGREHVLFIVACPVDDEHTRYIQLLARNDREEDVAAADLLALDRLVVAEDQSLCESMPIDFDLDPRAFVSVRADRITVEYRRYLASLRPT